MLSVLYFNLSFWSNEWVFQWVFFKMILVNDHYILLHNLHSLKANKLLNQTFKENNTFYFCPWP